MTTDGIVLDVVGPYLDVLTAYVRPGAIFECVDAMVALDAARRWWEDES